MKKVRGVLAVLVVMGLMMIGLSYAQPKIPKGDIPPRIPADVRGQIEKLYSENPVERGRAADELGKMGGKAAPAVPFLIGILGDGAELNEGDRSTSPGEKAARALVKIGKPAVDPLIKALNDEDPGVRRRAALALGEIKDGRAVNSLIIALRDEDSGVRKSAAEALVKIGSPSVNPLIGALKDKEPDVRKSAAEALAKIGSPSVNPLIGALKDRDPYVRGNAAESLGKIKDSRAVDPLIVALKKDDEDPEVRWRASMALGEIGKPALEPLIAALEDENSSVRSYAAEALGFTKDTRAVEPLIVALEDEEPGVRWGAAVALGKIKDSRAVDPLIAALKDEGWDYRNYAALALGEIGDSRAVGSLIEALNDDNSDVRRVAAEALKKITGQDFGEGQAGWREWWKKTKIAQLVINYPEIMEIEQQREIIDRSLKSSIEIQIPSGSGEGANDEIYIYFNEYGPPGSKIIKAETVSFSETMRIERDFYYMAEEGLIFVFEKEIDYAMGDVITENSYYFHNEKMILWLDNNGQEIPVTGDQDDYILSISQHIFYLFEHQEEYQADQYEEPIPDQPGADDQFEDDVPADQARSPAIIGIDVLADIGNRRVPYDGYSPGSCNNVPSLTGIVVEITVQDVGPGDRIRVTLSGSNAFTTDEEGYMECDDSELGEVAVEESSLARRGGGKLFYRFNAGWMCVIEVRAELQDGQHNDTWSERFYLGECAE